jgi:K+-sensing histidine kinase KdpD
MADDSEGLFYLALGPLAAILIGAALVPLRGFTTASNFAFVFVVLTIVVAEMGGRWAAVATALVSAMSLDFFLTQPYLRLTMYEKHDVIAVVGLTVCGLVASAFGTRRGRQTDALEAARRRLEMLHTALGEDDMSEAVQSRISRILRASREAVPLAAAVVRDERDTVVASADPSDAQRPLPTVVLQAGMLSIPDEGGRIALTFGGRRLGWLDVWHGGGRVRDESRRTLADLARSVAIALAAAAPPTLARS